MTTVLESINIALHKSMNDDPSIILMGEDIVDPYGGAFKVSRGLSTMHPDRVITTPISEAGIVGIATGMALQGFKPVVEIMFGDFSTLVVDQVVNHLTKFTEMFRKNEPLTMVIRTPMGGRRGYGPTHSQSLERLFFGIDSLRVVAPTHISGFSGELLYDALLRQSVPTLFIENKLQYLFPLIDPSINQEVEIIKPINNQLHIWAGVRGSLKPEISIFTYGYMLEAAIKAMLELAYSEEIFINVCAFTQISPFILSRQLEDEIGDHPVLIAEEGALGWGWGAEVAAQLCESRSKRIVRRLASSGGLIPAAPRLEQKVLPQVGDIVSIIKKMHGGL